MKWGFRWGSGNVFARMGMMPVFQVIDWDRHFENNKSRKVDRCGFVCVPNKQHGLGLLKILSLADGAAVYGVWHLIVGALSQQPRPRNGWLTNDGSPTGKPWTASDLATRWRRPVEEIERALNVLTSPEVGWIYVLSGHAVVDQCPRGGSELNGIELNGIEGNGKSAAHSCTEPKTARVPICEPKFPDFPIAARKGESNKWRLSDALISELASTYPAVDVPGESRRAWMWIKSNPARKKSARGMSRFLNSWMARQQDRGGSVAPKVDQPFKFITPKSSEVRQAMGWNN